MMTHSVPHANVTAATCVVGTMEFGDVAARLISASVGTCARTGDLVAFCTHVGSWEGAAMTKLSLLLPIVVAACTSMEMVPASDYGTVPQAARSQIDTANDAATVAARNELDAAVNAEKAARVLAAAPVSHKPVAASDALATRKNATMARI